MAKETFYFSHDYNARSDQKISKLLVKHGMLGYGLYWAIIETLYNNNNILEIDYDCIAYDLRSDSEIIKSVINDFGLFSFYENTFGSISVERRLNERTIKSKKAEEAANVRWAKDDKDEERKKAVECLFYAIKIFNENESFIKVGITTESVSRRYSGKLKNYEYEIIFSCENTVEKCLSFERTIQEKFKNHIPQIIFAGYKECIEISQYDELIKFVMQDNIFRNANINFRNANKGKESKENEIKLNDTIIEDNSSIEKEKNTKKEKLPNLTDEQTQMFEQARKYYLGNKGGLKAELDNFVKKYPDEWQTILPLLLPAIAREKIDKAQKLKNNNFNQQWKHFTTWINKRCWEEEYPNVTQSEVDSSLKVSTNSNGEQQVEVKQDRSSFPMYQTLKYNPELFPEGTESRCGYWVIKNKQCVATHKY